MEGGGAWRWEEDWGRSGCEERAGVEVEELELGDKGSRGRHPGSQRG